MKVISLTQGQFAKVDDADYEWLMQFRWYAIRLSGSSGFYARRNMAEPRESFYMHREIVGLLKGDKTQVDHRNHDTLDNQRSNVRRSTPGQNCFNSRIRSDNVSGFKGVSWNKANRVWESYIRVDKRRLFLGYHADAVTAARIYNAAALKHFGEFAFVNQLDEAQLSA